MKLKPLATLSPILLAMFSGAAHADLEPFTVGASETIEHQSNVNHSDDSQKVADWMSTTELSGSVDQPIGRNRFTASAAVNYTKYRKQSDRDATGYRAATALDWSTIGDLSGSIGADSARRQYQYSGFDGDGASSNGRNLETTNHVFAQAELGGMARWNLFAGVSGMNREYSGSFFRSNDEREVSTNFGTRYSTSPDLSFGVTGNFERGEYPHYVDLEGNPSTESFNSRSVSLTTRYKASGNSALDANVGYTTENSDIQATQRFVSGGLNWTWTPPSHFTVRLGLSRSMNGGVTSGNLNSLNDRSLNTTGRLDITYALTAKVSLGTDFSYIRRKYSNVDIPATLPDGTQVLEPANGTNHTTRVGLSVHYVPTRVADISCGASREVRTSGSAIVGLTPSYSDNVAQCTASVTFN